MFRIEDMIRLLSLPFAIVFGWFYYPFCLDGPSFCLWKGIFGIECPGCGLIRALCFLSHGMGAEAVSYNPFILPIIAILLYVFAAQLKTILTKGETTWPK